MPIKFEADSGFNKNFYPVLNPGHRVCPTNPSPPFYELKLKKTDPKTALFTPYMNRHIPALLSLLILRYNRGANLAALGDWMCNHRRLYD